MERNKTSKLDNLMETGFKVGNDFAQGIAGTFRFLRDSFAYASGLVPDNALELVPVTNTAPASKAKITGYITGGLMSAAIPTLMCYLAFTDQLIVP